jgi:succinoglycan biosynthesis transport protein ExoP
VLGLFIGLLLAFLLEYLDDTIKTEEDVKRVSNIRVLGVIPRFGLKADSSYYYPYSQGKYYKKPV